MRRRDAELTLLIEAWCAERSAGEIECLLGAREIPVANVRAPADALDEPVLKARREIVT